MAERRKEGWRGGIVRQSERIRSQLRFLRGPVLFLLCMSALGLLVMVVKWLDPIRRPVLTIVSCEYHQPWLSPNTFAANDAKRLADLERILDVSRADSTSLNYDELESLIEHISKSDQPTSFFSWQKTTNLVYVNALGLAVAQTEGTRLEPYLLPDDFSIRFGEDSFNADRVVPVSQLLDAVAKSKADQKIVVFDCQRLDHFWPKGVLRNQFVDAVQDLLTLHRDKYGDLFVLLSCSDDEITWTDNRKRHSCFGYYFLRGISGAADSEIGNSDGRITLQELFNYVRANVADWVQRNRADRQLPVLLSQNADFDDVVLAALDPQARIYDGAPGSSSDDETESTLHQLQTAWAAYYTLSRQEPRPVHYAPHLWRKLEASLLRADAFFRAADFAAIRDELQKVPFRTNDLSKAKQSPLFQQEAFSLSMLRFLEHEIDRSKDQTKDTMADQQKGAIKSAAGIDQANKQESTKSEQVGAKEHTNGKSNEPGNQKKSEGTDNADASPTPDGKNSASDDKKKKPTESKQKSESDRPSADKPQSLPRTLSPSQVNSLIQDVVQGNLSVVKFGRMLQKRSYSLSALPCEAELARMMAENWPDVKPPIDQRRNSQRAAELIRLREIGEQAAVAAGRYSPQVFPLLQTLVDEADTHQRFREDRFLCSAERTIVIGEDIDAVEDESKLYEESIRQAKRLAESVQICEQIIAELPYLLQVAAKRTWEPVEVDSNDRSFHQYLTQQTSSLIVAIRKLSVHLNSGPAVWDASKRGKTLTDIAALTSQLIETRSNLVQRVDAEIHSLIGSIENDEVGSEEAWRHIDALLSVPFACNDSETPQQLAANRIQLLRRSQRPIAANSVVLQVPNDATTSAETNSSAEEYIETIRQLVLAYFDLFAVGAAPRRFVDERHSRYSPLCAELWSRNYATAVANHSREDVVAADLACRILDVDLVDSSFPNASTTPIQVRKRSDLARFLIWQGLRRADDFWSGPKNSNQRYFAKTANRYLQRAQDVSPFSGEETTSLENRLSQLEAMEKRFNRHDSGGLLRSHPATVVFRGTDRESVGFAFQKSPGLPHGIARLTCSVNTDDLTVKQRLSDESATFAYSYEIARSTDDGLQTKLDAEIFFRGHVSRLSVPVLVASEVSGPTIEYRAEPTNQAQLVVRWAKIKPPASSILFVLDCSRSMNEDNRIKAVRDSLLQFSNAVSQSGLNVGVRLFGDQVVWQKKDRDSEAAARKDTRLVLPIQPFPGKEFLDTVSKLTGKGETPLFQALIQARDDFAQVEESDKIVVVVSDGADNWAKVGLKPGINELQKAYRGSNIRVHTIGFQTNPVGFQQLQRISAVTNGTAVQANRSDELLKSVFGLAGVYNFEILSRQDNRLSQRSHTATLGFTDEPIEIPAGMYDVRIFDSRQKMVAERSQISIQGGEKHVLLFQGDGLTYPPLNLSNDVADVRNPLTHTLLRIMRADFGNGRLQLEVALINESEPNWKPHDFQIRINPRGGPARVYLFHGLPSNGREYYFPVWKFQLENWPNDSMYADVEASWSNSIRADRPQWIVDWRGNEGLAALPPGFRLTRREFKSIDVNGETRNAAKVTLVFPKDQTKQQNWSMRFQRPLSFSRQTYNTSDGVYTSHFMFSDGRPPKELTITGPSNDVTRSRLSTVVSLRLRKIN